MKMEHLKNWFCGFERGLADLEPQQREVLLRACAVNCVQGGTIGTYRRLFDESGGDLDRFFSLLDSLEGVRGEIVSPGKAFNLRFGACTCPLHGAGCVHTPLLCECSRQSVLYVLSEFWKDLHFEVELRASILRGDAQCVLHIHVE